MDERPAFDFGGEYVVLMFRAAPLSAALGLP
jgi:hypothetical protein